jgi:peptide/nickel transport system ATP-binding protein
MSDALLQIEDLSIEYRAEGGVVRAVGGVDLTLRKGETLGLVGETGAGKTTAALGILRLIPDPPGKIVSGRILFAGEDLLQKSEAEMRKIRGNRISMIFQDPMTALNPVLTVGNQVAEVIRQHQKMSRVQAEQKAADMLRTVGIAPDRMGEYPHQFSGGMKQRVVIAIALACNPALLIADEPTTALDVTIQAQVLALMGQLKKQMQTSMLLITHDLGVVAEICDRVAIMYAGQIVETGTLEEIYRSPGHPYTQGLFGSIPSPFYKVRRLSPIQGLMPDPTRLPPGCRFSPRCPYRMEVCSQCSPQAYDAGGGHRVKCWRLAPEEGRDRLERAAGSQAPKEVL